MISIVIWLALFAAVYLVHRQSRDFVRRRLRYVDAVQQPSAPWIAGGATALLAAVLVFFLPVLGIGTALSLGLAVGTGVAAGARDTRNGYWVTDGN